MHNRLAEAMRHAALLQPTPPAFLTSRVSVARLTGQPLASPISVTPLAEAALIAPTAHFDISPAATATMALPPVQSASPQAKHPEEGNQRLGLARNLRFLHDLPRASTTHMLESSNDTSIPA